MMGLEVTVDQFGMMAVVRAVVDVLRRKERQRKHAEHASRGDTRWNPGPTVHR
jgi:hypothetical protein